MVRAPCGASSLTALPNLCCRGGMQAQMANLHNFKLCISMLYWMGFGLSLKSRLSLLRHACKFA